MYWWEITFAVDEEVTTERVRASECIITDTGMAYLIDTENKVICYVTYEPLIKIKRLKKHKSKLEIAKPETEK